MKNRFGGVSPSASARNVNSKPTSADAARAYMVALQADIARGHPNEELVFLHDAWASAGRELLTLCGGTSGQAPMVLVGSAGL